MLFDKALPWYENGKLKIRWNLNQFTESDSHNIENSAKFSKGLVKKTQIWHC